MKTRVPLLIVVLSCLSFFAKAESNGYKISVELKNYDQSETYLGYHLGDKQYLKDTAQVDKSGKFVFKGEEELAPGMYLIVMPPDNKFIQVLINKEEQYLHIFADVNDPIKSIEVDGSEDNIIFYKYLNFLNEKRAEANKLNLQIDSLSDEATKKDVNTALGKLDDEVSAYMNRLISKYPNTFTAKIIYAGKEIEIPDFSDTPEKDLQKKRYLYYREHYFDNIDMADPRMLRSPNLYPKIDNYLKKLTVPHPDSINSSIDRILSLLKPCEESFKYYLVHLLNTYAKDKHVGMDAVYVHIVEKYYEGGKAPWTDEEQLAKIVANAKTLKPILIGKEAPNLLFQTRDNKPFKIHDFKKPYAILIFWAPDCGHCKKTMPILIDFYESYKDKVDVLAICSKLTDKVKTCWEYIDENELNYGLIHLVDPYMRSRFKSVYDVKTTPMTYILDKDHIIRSKRIGIEQFGEVMDQIILEDQKKMEEGQ